MVLMYSSAVDKRHRVYHKCGCMYANRIKLSNRVMKSRDKISKRYRECKCCAGLKGGIHTHRRAIRRWSEKNNMVFTYHKASDTLYIETEMGFWKLFLKPELGMYLLYHRNTYTQGMKFSVAKNGEFHRQGDVRATDSLESIVEYIIAHERAKKIIAVDYRKLPQQSRKQKMYYRAAERRDRRKQMQRMDMLFAMIEGKDTGERMCSFG